MGKMVLLDACRPRIDEFANDIRYFTLETRRNKRKLGRDEYDGMEQFLS